MINKIQKSKGGRKPGQIPELRESPYVDYERAQDLLQEFGLNRKQVETYFKGEECTE